MQLTKWTCRQSPTFNKKGTEHRFLWRQRMAHPLFPPPTTTTTTAACKIETESSAWRCSGFRKRYFISICISIHIIWRRIGWSFSICARWDKTDKPRTSVLLVKVYEKKGAWNLLSVFALPLAVQTPLTQLTPPLELSVSIKFLLLWALALVVTTT